MAGGVAIPSRCEQGIMFFLPTERRSGAMDRSLPPPTLGMGLLNLHWILQGVEAMMAAHGDLQRLLLESRLGRDLASIFIDDSVRQLETVNAVRKSMSAAVQHRMKIKYALNLARKSWSSREEAELERAKIYLEAAIGDVERKNSPMHTGGWRLEEDDRMKKLIKLAKKKKNNEVAMEFAYKLTEASFVSSLVLAALLAALDSSSGLGSAPSSREPDWVPSLWDELKEEADLARRRSCSSALLEGVCSCLRQIVSVLGTRPRDEGDDVQMKQLLQMADKKLEYIDSSFQILEEQIADLFSKLVASRGNVLSVTSIT